MIQNADDAGAKVVRFYIDNRQHSVSSCVNERLAKHQGPALIAFNDAVFTELDWEGIKRLQDSVKAEDPFNVGKYGIGFNSVYHITGVQLSYMYVHNNIMFRQDSSLLHSTPDSIHVSYSIALVVAVSCS